MIEVRRYGAAGPPVLVLHGGPGAPGSVARLAGDLGQRFQAYEPLQRRGGELPLTVARHVEDLAAVAPSQALLVGWSWGAMLALSYAATFPDRVTALALVGVGTYDPEARALYQRNMATRVDRPRKEALTRALEAEADPARRDALLAQLGALADAAMTVEALDLPPAAPGLPVDATGHRQTWDDVLRLQAEGTEPARFATITAPARMFHGEEDPHPGPETHALLRRTIPHLDYVGYPRCGHTPWIERHARERFLGDLTAWLATR